MYIPPTHFRFPSLSSASHQDPWVNHYQSEAMQKVNNNNNNNKLNSKHGCGLRVYQLINIFSLQDPKILKCHFYCCLILLVNTVARVYYKIIWI